MDRRRTEPGKFSRSLCPRSEYLRIITGTNNLLLRIIFVRNWKNPVLLESLIDRQQLAQQSNNSLNEQNDQIPIKNLLDWNINSDLTKRRQVFGLDNYTVYNQNIRRLEDHAKMMWPIIAPGNPPQNSGFNINYSTSKILLIEMRFCVQII